jgi:hypothetical protein
VNGYGQAAKQAYDPHLVLRYVEGLEAERLRIDGWTDAVHGRTIRRWRGAKGITPWSLARILAGYGRKVEDFEAWAGPAGRLRG